MGVLFVVLLLAAWAESSTFLGSGDGGGERGEGGEGVAGKYANAYIAHREEKYSLDWDRSVYTQCVDSSMVALTFDDGVKVLDFLKKHDIKATFFVLGSQVDRRTLQRMVDDGHVIGSHSWDHPNFVHLSEWDMKWQLEATDNAIHAAVQRRPRFFRPPEGAIDERVSRLVRREGYAPINWDIDSNDWHGDAWAASSNIRQGILGWDKALCCAAERSTRRRPGGHIILQHDHYFEESVGRATIKAAKQKGLRFVTLDQCLGMEPYRNQRQVDRRNRPKIPSDRPKIPSDRPKIPSTATTHPPATTPAAPTGQVTRTITRTATVTRSTTSSAVPSPTPLSTIAKAGPVPT